MNRKLAAVAAAVAVVAVAVAVVAVAVATVAVAAAVAVVAVAVAAAVAAAAAAVAVAADNEGYIISIKISGFSILLSLISFGITYYSEIDFSWILTIPIALLFITVTEAFFFLDKKKPKKKENKMFFTAKRKVVSAFYSASSILIIGTIYQIVKNNFEEILKWVRYIGAGLLILAIIGIIGYVYLKLNSLKYKS